MFADVGCVLRLGNLLHIDLAFPLHGDPSLKDVHLLVETKRSF